MFWGLVIKVYEVIEVWMIVLYVFCGGHW